MKGADISEHDELEDVHVRTKNKQRSAVSLNLAEGFVDLYIWWVVWRYFK